MSMKDDHSKNCECGFCRPDLHKEYEGSIEKMEDLSMEQMVEEANMFGAVEDTCNEPMVYAHIGEVIDSPDKDQVPTTEAEKIVTEPSSDVVALEAKIFILSDLIDTFIRLDDKRAAEVCRIYIKSTRGLLNLFNRLPALPEHIAEPNMNNWGLFESPTHTIQSFLDSDATDDAQISFTKGELKEFIANVEFGK